MTKPKRKSTVMSIKEHERLMQEVRDENPVITEINIPEEVFEALEFYADKGNYRLIKSFSHYYKIIKDGGKIAQGALDALTNR